jgi:hypothetical protein
MSTFGLHGNSFCSWGLKTEVDFVPRRADLRCDLKTKVDFSCSTERTLKCDLKIKVDFRLLRAVDFDKRLQKQC